MCVRVLHFIWYCIYVLILINSFLKTIFEKLYYKKIKEHRETEENVRTRNSIFFSGFQMTGEYDKSTDLKKYTYR